MWVTTKICYCDPILRFLLFGCVLNTCDYRKFDHGLGQILHEELHWLDVPDRVIFKLAVTVHRCLNGRAPPYLSDYCAPVASADRRHLRFHQLSTACSTSLSAQHLRPSGLFSCRTHSLELTPEFHLGPDHRFGLFQTAA